MPQALPDLSVTISQRRLACVLDPSLALSPFGLPLVQRLGKLMEIWVPRELWHILDNTRFYLEQPLTLLSGRETAEASIAMKSQAVLGALREWERIRLENDPARRNCYWIGDGPMESFLPDSYEPEIVWRFETLCAALDRRITAREPLPSGYRDVAALAATLPAAFVLTHFPSPETSREPPDICVTLGHWGVPCIPVPADDEWHRDERAAVRHLFTQAGLIKWVWAGFRPAVLHLAALGADTVRTTTDDVSICTPDTAWTEPPPEASLAEPDYWLDARAFWYRL